jgi:carbon-monoxide dehydrogenase small subunit
MIHYKNHVAITLNINGEARKVVVRPADTLLRVLRENLGLRGSKLGCENGDCGACTVLVNGQPVKSCMLLAVEVEGEEIRTIEGMRATPTQEAFLAEAGFQCGFCTPGFILNTHALLESNPNPDDAKIRLWLESNLCRCTGYEGIERAVKSAIRNQGDR